MGGYLLLAVGLINWRYQNADEGIASRSLLIIIPGVLVIGMTFVKSLHVFMASRAGIAVLSTIGTILVGLSILN